MKYLDSFKIYEAIRIPKTKINGIYYHGTVVKDKEVFRSFSFGYSDWDTIWFTDNEKVAEEFSDNAFRDEENEYMIIYKVQLKEKDIANIDYSLFRRIEDEEGMDDMREYIPTLIRRGYSGWKTLGAVNSIQYDDIALFDLDNVKILSAKIKFKGNWTDYMELSEIQEMVDPNSDY